MPLVRDGSGELVGAVCISQCGALERLDARATVNVPGQNEPQQMTLLICPVCHYCEWYYGAVEEESI